MSATKFTPHQQQAIVDQGQNILVSASAGSGKTSVLVERVIQKILHGDSVANLLVVTFTDAAAKGMRDRIQRALRQAMDQTNDYDLRQRLRTEINQLGIADISTLHAFCLHLIKRYYYLIDLDPQFRLLTDTTELILLTESVWDDVRETLYANEDEKFEQLTQNFSNDRGDEGLTNVVSQLDSFANATPTPYEWLQQLPALYEVEGTNLTETDFYQTQVKPILMDILQQLSIDMAQGIELALEDVFSKVKGLLEDELMQIDEVLELVQHGSWNEIRAKLFNLNFNTMRGPKDDEAKATFERIKVTRSECKKQLNELGPAYFALDEQQTIDTMKAAQKIVTELADVTWQYREAYQAEKKQRHVLDFSDLEHYALAILTSNSVDGQSVVKQLRDHYGEIMVDEYQDTNQLQESILQTLTTEHPGNLFMVGDVKQSIYQFRLADPGLFLRKYEQYRQPQSDDGEAIILAENFRSVKNVTDFTNLIFKQLMDKKVGEMDYDEAAQLQYGAIDYPKEPTATEVLLYESENSTSQDELELVPDDKMTGEVQMVGQRIKQMIQNNEQLYDRKEQKMRPITYGDITLLVPTRKNNNLIVEQFSQLEIPVTVNDAQNYFQATEVRIMMSLLRVVDNPYQDIPLAAVLRSPIVGLDENELAYLRIQNKTDEYFAAVKTFHDEFDANLASEFAQHIYDKIDRFLHQLVEFRLIANQNRLVKLIWEIYETTGFLDYVGGMPGGRQRQANLHALYERAHVYEESSFKGLFQFVRFIEQMQQQNQDLGEAPAQASNDTVSVMTIHASKGLEFPVVFLMDATHQFNKDRMRQDYLMDAQGGIGITYLTADRVKVETLQKQILKDAVNRKDQAEQMRLLYVALTRAEQRLLIVGTYSNVEKAITNWQRAFQSERMQLPDQIRAQTNNFMDWIGMGLVRHPQFDASLLTTDDVWSGLTGDATKFEIKIWHASDLNQSIETGQDEVESSIQEQLNEANKLTDQISDISRAAIKQVLHFNYQHTAATMTTAYQSVSEIKRLFEDPDNFQLGQLEFDPQARQKGRYVSDDFGQPKFMQTTVTPSAAEVGTATHLVLQTLDLRQSPTLAAVDQVITRLTAGNIITEEIATRINREQILQFFETDLGKLILARPDHLKREVPFSMLLNGNQLFAQLADPTERILIHGIIDGYLELEDGVCLFDYKTDQIHPDGEQQAEVDKIVQRYRGQVNLYAQALQQMTAKPVVHKYLYLLSVNQLVEI
ncbi:helicase-exonuclease AddAB subunit AddA [Paucilactobacillus kaifaensis]|uniref:helicase-exonuclease AddAB subunit AddA n=1 Tax=Paucilactobacillus kaifaensis TaxID=2559921 RepID=UPI0010F5FF36|nr:helicase-exonuclease AddAB subunit AddA [Paucilactobacillus kaifaensis]